jgi:serine/threonine protein kinase
MSGDATLDAGATATTATVGAWHILEKLGSGTYATVYRAAPSADDVPRRGTHRALKLFDLGDSSSLFYDEVAAYSVMGRRGDVARHLPHMHDWVVARDVSVAKKSLRHAGALVLDMLPHTLHEDAGRRGFAPDKARSVSRHLCGAVCDVHAAGYAHRDLKTSNILRRSGGPYLLGDLGLVCSDADGRAATCRASNGTRVTHSVRAPAYEGTLSYLPPEAAAAYGSDTTLEGAQRADAWALGALLLKLMHGTRTYTSPLVAEVVSSRAKRPLGERLRVAAALQQSDVVVVHVPGASDVCDAARGLLDVDPERRWSAAEALDWLS